MRKIFLIIVLILSFAFDVRADDVMAETICNVVDYIQKLGGPMFTLVIISAALLTIFAKMQWHSLIVLCMFTAAFFGANNIVKAIIPSNINAEVCGTSNSRTQKQPQVPVPLPSDSTTQKQPQVPVPLPSDSTTQKQPQVPVPSPSNGPT